MQCKGYTNCTLLFAQCAFCCYDADILLVRFLGNRQQECYWTLLATLSSTVGILWSRKKSSTKLTDDILQKDVIRR